MDRPRRRVTGAGGGARDVRTPAGAAQLGQRGDNHPDLVRRRSSDGVVWHGRPRLEHPAREP